MTNEEIEDLIAHLQYEYERFTMDNDPEDQAYAKGLKYAIKAIKGKY